MNFVRRYENIYKLSARFRRHTAKEADGDSDQKYSARTARMVSQTLLFLKNLNVSSVHYKM
jgi:hypothetical protein